MMPFILKSCLAWMLLVAGCLSPSIAFAQGYVLEGKVAYYSRGDIYLTLVTEREYDNDVVSAYSQIMSPDNANPGAVAFHLDDVPTGVYVLKCYQDVNGNSEFDRGFWGPVEPWGTYRRYRPSFRAPHFDEVSFPVKGDLTGLYIELEN